MPLVPAGRRDVYAGWFRSDSRGVVSVLELTDVQDRPALFSTFMMWMLARLPGGYNGSGYAYGFGFSRNLSSPAPGVRLG